MTIPIQRVTSSDTIMSIRGRSGSEDFSDIDCQSSSYSEHSRHPCGRVSDIIDNNDSNSCKSSIYSTERIIPIKVESDELFVDEVSLERQASGQEELQEEKKQEEEEKGEKQEEELKEEEKQEEGYEGQLAASWKTIPGSSASGREESETIPEVSSSAVVDPSSEQEKTPSWHQVIRSGAVFEAKEEMLGRKPPSGARTAPLPR